MKLTTMSSEVFNYVKENGGKIKIDEICTAVGRASRSVGANVTDLAKKGLVERVKESNEAEDGKDITYVVMTEEGAAFVPTED